MHRFIFAVLFVSAIARAQPTIESVAPTHWSVGAGFGFANVGLASIMMPGASVLIEYRLSPRVFALFNGSASYSETTVSGARPSTAFRAGASVAIRHVLNPGGAIEVSWFGGGRTAWSSGDSIAGLGGAAANTTSVTTNQFSVGLSAGVAFERALVEGLALRVSTSVLGAEYVVWSSTQASSAPASGFDVGFKFNPTLELRYSF